MCNLGTVDLFYRLQRLVNLYAELVLGLEELFDFHHKLVKVHLTDFIQEVGKLRLGIVDLVMLF